jgi:TetR/AcrR family transcriptional repressor of nem operon
MRVSTEEKERSRARILAAAGRLFRENGVQGASVADIMREAGMTHGGFYRHFADKDALLAASLSEAFESFAEPLDDASVDHAVAVAEFRARYLSTDHLATPGQGCPAATLGPDIARTDTAVRAAFSHGVNRVIEGLARGNGPAKASRADAIRDLAMLVGAMVLARGATDPLAAEILNACESPPAFTS